MGGQLAGEWQLEMEEGEAEEWEAEGERGEEGEHNWSLKDHLAAQPPPSTPPDNADAQSLVDLLPPV